MSNDVAISLQDVTFTYEGEVVALRNLNLQAHQGEFVVVLGANGAGKSTLCYLISGIVPQIYGGRRGGVVSIAGIDPWDELLFVTAQKCGVLMQDPEVQLFMPTLKAELAFGPANLGVPSKEIFQRSEAALKLVRLDGLEERNPRDLSGGQKQRAALASVLTMQPQVLVLDEPTSQLDPVGRWEVGEAIEQLKRRGDLTIVMTTHETEEVLHLADQVLVLERGETVLQGTPQEVFSQAARLEEVGVKTPALVNAQMHFYSAKPGQPGGGVKIDAGASISEVAARIQSSIFTGELRIASQATPPEPAPKNESQPILEVRQLTVEYPGPPKVVALQGIDLQVDRGELIGVIGQNGSGKSTLVKCMVGLIKPRAGQVLFHGQDIRALSVGGLARRIGLVLQNPDYQLFTPSCREEVRFGLRNVGIPPGEIEALVDEALGMVGLEEEADLFPFRLSFGDRRKLAVAATIALKPEVLIMDEPTTAQDHRGRYQLAELARRFHEERGGTVVIITHDVDLIARYAQRLVVLHEGRILLDGPAAEVFAQTEELKKSFVVPPVATQLASEVLPPEAASQVMTLEDLFRFIVPT